MLMKEKANAVLENENYLTKVTNRHHVYFTDEPSEVGGQDKYTTPQELLLGSLASCVATTLRMYANRKGWESTIVRLISHWDLRWRLWEVSKKVVKHCRVVGATVMLEWPRFCDYWQEKEGFRASCRDEIQVH